MRASTKDRGASSESSELRDVVLREQSAFEDDLRVALEDCVDDRVAVLAGVDDVAAGLGAQARLAVLGGKRLRASFCYWGGRAAGSLAGAAVMRAGVALELFHAGALVHDDVMDDSDVRRGRPSAHRALAVRRRRTAEGPATERFGESAAILLGDLLMSWSAEVFASCRGGAALPADAAALYGSMRTQVMAGQYLELWEQAGRTVDADRARRILLYKSARYSVQQPLLIGAALAGADDDVRAGLSSFGIDVGEAFQLRDDVLGAFGDPAVTGKPVGDDIRDGKRTQLLCTVLQRLPASDRGHVEHCLAAGLVGDPEVEVVRDAMVSTGTLAEVEARIDALHGRAVGTLAGLAVDPEVAAALTVLAAAATKRVT